MEDQNQVDGQVEKLSPDEIAGQIIDSLISEEYDFEERTNVIIALRKRMRAEGDDAQKKIGQLLERL